MDNPFDNKTILLGVTGSIAAYKAAELASHLHQAGAIVETVLTPSATKFITPLTFQSVTGRKAYVEDDLWGSQGHVTHIGLARAADLIIIAPSSANTIAKLAGGFGDNLLLVTALAATCPILIAPAMDAGMYQNPATQSNIKCLIDRGVKFIGPIEGHLASGLTGLGRLSEPNDILGNARWILSKNGHLCGKKVVVTAGGTREPLDPVRFITNRSSGRQGYALAQAALDRGACVSLISGPANLPIPFGCQFHPILTAEQMYKSVLDECVDADFLIMAAAVADFRPVGAAEQKIKKDGQSLQVVLNQTVDILEEVYKFRVKSGRPKFVIGFAAETENLLNNAMKKVKSKHLDLIVANDIGASGSGFDVQTNQVTFIFKDGRIEPQELMDKNVVASKIIDIISQWV